MGLLDAVTGGGGLMGMLPGANLLPIVAKGLELIKDLFEQGNTKGADAVLKFLNDVLKDMPSGASTAAEPQPFTPPQTHEASNVFNMSFTLPASNQMVSHGGLPTVDGSPQGDQMITDAARPFVEGSDAAKSRALSQGSNEWLTVMWAMHQNPNIQYNADTQRFFTQMSDGSKMDVCSLQDLQSVIQQNGGYNRQNPVALPAVNSFLSQKIGEAKQTPLTATITLDLAKASRLTSGANEGPSIDDLTRQIEELKKKLQALEAAQQVMNSGASITVTIGR